jgi:hypothetical protein
MNKLLLILILISFKSNGQDNFEGLIKFSTEITTIKSNQKRLQKKITDKYGDSLIMYYSKTGDFRRVHLNSAEFGADSQLYIAKKGKLYFKKKNSTVIDSLDSNKNSIKLISKRKIENVKIMDLECECYEYKTISKSNRNVTLKYCFSIKSPEINYKLYSQHKDFYLNEFYQTAKRPYLKFSMETDVFKLTYTATELIVKEIGEDMFKIK